MLAALIRATAASTSSSETPRLSMSSSGDTPPPWYSARRVETRSAMRMSSMYGPMISRSAAGPIARSGWRYGPQNTISERAPYSRALAASLESPFRASEVSSTRVGVYGLVMRSTVLGTSICTTRCTERCTPFWCANLDLVLGALNHRRLPYAVRSERRGPTLRCRLGGPGCEAMGRRVRLGRPSSRRARPTPLGHQVPHRLPRVRARLPGSGDRARGRSRLSWKSGSKRDASSTASSPCSKVSVLPTSSVMAAPRSIPSTPASTGCPGSIVRARGSVP